jgi:hypothetical protein
MYMNWNKVLLYMGILEMIVGTIVLLFVSTLVGLIILVVGVFDLGVVFFWPSLLGGAGSQGDEAPPDEE